MAALTVRLQKHVMYSWWQSNLSLAASCEHAFYKCISKRRWFTGLEGKWLRVTDERAKATSPKTAPVYINIYLVRLWVSRSAVKTPESILCVFVCVHAGVHTLNATIQPSELYRLKPQWNENPSITQESVQEKNYALLVQRARGKWEGKGQQGWTPANQGNF